MEEKDASCKEQASLVSNALDRAEVGKKPSDDDMKEGKDNKGEAGTVVCVVVCVVGCVVECVDGCVDGCVDEYEDVW